MSGFDHNVLRNLTFGRRFDWEIELTERPGGDSLFRELSAELYRGVKSDDPRSIFLPAQTVEYPRASVQSKEFEELRVKFPEGVQARMMTITFFDNAEYSLMRFFDRWMNNEISRGGDFLVAYLGDIVREITVNKFAPGKIGRNTPVDSKRYLVYPDGELPESLDSSASDAYTFPVQFVIAGG